MPNWRRRGLWPKNTAYNKLIATDAALDGKELAPRVDDIFDRFRDARPDPFSSSAEFVSRHR
jgi:hypothetical protein